jgi:hypothetical protein
MDEPEGCPVTGTEPARPRLALPAGRLLGRSIHRKTQMGAERAELLYFNLRSEMKSVRASQELTVLTALFLPSFSAHRS